MTKAEAKPHAGLTPRQSDILQMVGESGYATLESLAQRLDVSVQSIRRDIIHLDGLCLLQRFHGGAGPVDGTVRLGYAEKSALASAAKARIGKAAAALLNDGEVVFLDVGTTAEATARAIKARRMRLHLFTNSVASAAILAGETSIQLHVLGGASRGADGSLVGAATLAAIEPIHFDCAVIGFSGFAADGTILDHDLEKIAVKQAAMRRSVRRILVGDQSKFQRRAMASIGRPRDFTHFVTDALPPEPLRATFERSKLRLLEA